MKNAKFKGRDIHFFSKKNQEMRLVHTEAARSFAEELEGNTKVISYDCSVNWEKEVYSYLTAIEIRKSYFSEIWQTDFVVKWFDGSITVYEVELKSAFKNLATVEKLELSRRYWKQKGINKWKVVVVEKNV